MEHTLHFASGTHIRSRRTHAALLAGILFGLALPCSAAPERSRGDSALWERAARVAEASRWLFPGRTVIEENVTRDKTDTRSRITAELHPFNSGDPQIAVTEVRIDDLDHTAAKAAEIATGLTPLIERLYTPSHPLSLHKAVETEPAGETMIGGALCRGFVSRIATDGLTVESTTWIDRDLGFARRIEFRALDLPFRKDGATIQALQGATDYALDPNGHWVLVRHEEHSEVKARIFLSSVEFLSDKTITCDRHWEYKGARRRTAAKAN